jgi:hypothetical protein
MSIDCPMSLTVQKIVQRMRGQMRTDLENEAPLNRVAPRVMRRDVQSRTHPPWWCHQWLLMAVEDRAWYHPFEVFELLTEKGFTRRVPCGYETRCPSIFGLKCAAYRLYDVIERSCKFVPDQWTGRFSPDPIPVEECLFRPRLFAFDRHTLDPLIDATE